MPKIDPEILSLNSAAPEVDTPTAPATPVASAAPAAPSISQPVSAWPSSTDALVADEAKIPDTNSSQQFARNLGETPVTNEPSSWSRSILSAWQRTLSGVVAPGKVPAGGGWLEGVAAVAAARRNEQLQNQEMAMKQQQLNIENSRENQRLSLEQQRMRLAVSEANMREFSAARIARNADRETQAKMLESAQKAAKVYEDLGAPELGVGLMPNEIQQKLDAGKLDASQVHSFVDGFQDAIDPRTGKPIIGDDGLPKQIPTRTLVGPAPQGSTVSLTKDQASYLRDHGQGDNISEGLKLAPSDFYLLWKRANELDLVGQNVEKAKAETAEKLSSKDREQAEAREKNLTADEKAQQLRAKALFAPWLNSANGDPVVAIQLMAKDPKASANVAAVQSLYGPGTLQRIKQDTIKNLNTEIAEGEKQLVNNAKADVMPQDKLSADEVQDVKNQLFDAKVQRNKTLGLAPYDPDKIAESVQRIDNLKLPPDQIRQVILTSKTMPQDAKNYLLRHYGFTLANVPAQQTK